MKWINDYKRNEVIPKITSNMDSKGYRSFDKDLIIRHKAMYNPFRFKWTVISRSNSFTRIQIDEEGNWEGQVPPRSIPLPRESSEESREEASEKIKRSQDLANNHRSLTSNSAGLTPPTSTMASAGPTTTSAVTETQTSGTANGFQPPLPP